MNFLAALHAMKSGRAVRRQGWGWSIDTALTIQPAGKVLIAAPIPGRPNAFTNGHEEFRPERFVLVSRTDGSMEGAQIAPTLPDMLAEDWEVLA